MNRFELEINFSDGRTKKELLDEQDIKFNLNHKVKFLVQFNKISSINLIDNDTNEIKNLYLVGC